MSRQGYRGGAAGSSGAPSAQSMIELEKQFLLRLPEEPAEALRQALRSGAPNIHQRLNIQLEPEDNRYLRKGQVRQQLTRYTFF